MGGGDIQQKRKLSFFRIKMDYCYVVQPSQLLLSVILVKTKRNIGFAPLGSRLSNENGNFACF